MEKAIGERFEYRGKTYEVVEADKHSCEKCGLFFHGVEWCSEQNCIPSRREDGKDVIFKEVK